MWGFPISIATGDATGYPSSSRPKRALEGPASRGPRPEPLRPLHAGRSAEAPRPPLARPVPRGGGQGSGPGRASNRTPAPARRAIGARDVAEGAGPAFPNAASGAARAIAGVRAPSATRRHFQRYQAPARRVTAVSGLCLLRAAGVKRTITRRERTLNAASVRAGTWRFSQASPLSLPNPRRLALTGSRCYIGPGDVQRRCPFVARPGGAR